jgi:hypothetical protein
VNRQQSSNSSSNVDHDRLDGEGEMKKLPASLTSRVITILGLCSLAAIIAVMLFTSERNGPGSQLLTATTENAANTPVSDVDAIAQTTQPDAKPDASSQCVASETMPGGDNFYVPNAPIVENLGTGLVVRGTVREAGTCAPVRNARIQIWLNTLRGGEGDPSNRGSVMTDENGRYRLETSPVVSQFGQPHVHIAYDDGAYRPLFLRAVMENENVSSFTVDFFLEPNNG